MARTHTIELAAGRLDLTILRGERPLDELLIVGDRPNPLRPFIFVSKVLGKHWPVKPSIMSWTHGLLASLLGPLPGPVLFLAMAETAIGLGRGVFESWSAVQGQEALFLQTTRYGLAKPVAMRIDEAHSHARFHLVYEPDGEAAAALFRSARTLVVIDDEVSTGRTLATLVKEYLKLNPALESVRLACLTNWLPDGALEALSAETGRPLAAVSLLEGHFKFEPAGPPPKTPAARSVGDFSFRDEILATNFGRLGLTPAESRALTARAEAAADALKPPPRKPVRVIGTGEFVHEPFALARRLESLRVETVFQSTTRTPMPPGRAAASLCFFKDNYGDDIDNFLYNAPTDYPGTTLVVYETGPASADHALLKLLGAQAVIL
jgi:hypothetical protein